MSQFKVCEPTRIERRGDVSVPLPSTVSPPLPSIAPEKVPAPALSGDNLYTGATTIGSGETLALFGSGSIAASSGVVDDGTFDISGTTSGASIKTLSGTGDVTLGSNTLTLTAGAGTFSGAIDGSGGLTVDGSGTETLSGDNLYTGATTIGSGETLALFGSGSIAASSGVTIDNNATLDLSSTASTSFLPTIIFDGSTGTVDIASTMPSGVVLGFGVTRSPVGRSYLFKQPGQSPDRRFFWRASASHQPYAC